MNNKFWSFILIVIWLFILVLFTKDQVFDLQYVSAERETLISKREQKIKEHSNLSNISKEIKSVKQNITTKEKTDTTDTKNSKKSTLPSKTKTNE